MSLIVTKGKAGLNSVEAAEVLGLKDQIRANWIIGNIGKKYLAYIKRKRPPTLVPYEVVSDSMRNHRDAANAYKWVARKEFSQALISIHEFPYVVRGRNVVYREGKRWMRQHIVYERDPKARAACLAEKGYKCEICGFDFEKKYGTAGRTFAEVHHQHMVSKGKRKYRNPAAELLVVCSNCHSIIHRRAKPYTKQEVIKMIKGR